MSTNILFGEIVRACGMDGKTSKEVVAQFPRADVTTRGSYIPLALGSLATRGFLTLIVDPSRNGAVYRASDAADMNDKRLRLSLSECRGKFPE